MIKPLTSFRFFAAFFVFLSHLAFFKDYENLEWIFDRIFVEGYVGVSFFFVLSGFILTYNYSSQFQTLNKYTLEKFYIARIARIYPVHLLTFVISLPFLYIIIFEQPLKTVVSSIINVFLLQSLVPLKEVYFSLNAVSWSLSNEMFFYLFLPFLIFISIKKRMSIIKLLSFVLSIWVVSTTVVIIFGDVSINHWLFYVFPLFRISDFVIGVLLALVFLKREKISKLSKKHFTMLESISIIGLVVAIYFFPYVHQSLRYGVYYIPFMSLIIYVFAFQRGLISKFLSSRIFLFLGEISFAFYMIHQLVLRYSEQLPIINSSPIALASFSLIVSLMSSSLIYLYYEVPLRNLLKHRKLSNFISRKEVIGTEQ